MKKFFALIVTAVTLLSIVAAPLAGAAPFLTDPNGRAYRRHAGCTDS